MPPNGRPEYSLEPAGSPKLSYVNALYFSGEITNVDSPYMTPSRVPSVTSVAQVRLELPVR